MIALLQAEECKIIGTLRVHDQIWFSGTAAWDRQVSETGFGKIFGKIERELSKLDWHWKTCLWLLPKGDDGLIDEGMMKPSTRHCDAPALHVATWSQMRPPARTPRLDHPAPAARTVAAILRVVGEDVAHCLDMNRWRR